MQVRPSASPKSHFHAAAPVIAGLVGGAFAMSAAFAMSTATRPERPLVASPMPGAATVQVVNHVAHGDMAGLTRIVFSDPLPGYAINSPFGMRRMPWEEGGRLHEGVDIAAPAGAGVRATLAGTVTRTGMSLSYGRYVEVSHGDGLVSFYAHLGRAARGVKPGVPVAAGQLIGYVGGTGRSTGSHLHFELRKNGRPLNPASFLGQSFASAEVLPISDASRYSRRVRVAVVSSWPASVRAPVAPAGSLEPSGSAHGEAPEKAGDGRVRAVIQPRSSSAAPTAALPASNRPAPAQTAAPTAQAAASRRESVDLDEVVRSAAGRKPEAAPAPEVKARPLTVPGA